VVRRLGTVRYDEALALQRSLVEERKADRIPDTLLLLEHPPVITLGVRGDGGRANIVATTSRLAELGIEVFETGRGGDVTYHGPGQIVGYPIIDLKPDRCDVHRYVRDVEEVMIRVRAEKIAAIGVRISRWVTSHGFALNVSTNLDHFALIVPCGISDRGVTSLERLVGSTVPPRVVEDALIRRFCDVFDRVPTTEWSASLTAHPGR
jgi:lipoyl(octanoyl) transferase